MFNQEDPAFQASLQLRDRLLMQEPWWSTCHLASRVCTGDSDSERMEHANRLRTDLKVLGVRYLGEYLYPACQFTAEGRPHPRMQELLGILPVTDENWAIVFWFFQATGRLGRRRPADVFASDPDAVITAARLDFQATDNDW